jgi:putative endonuclease
LGRNVRCGREEIDLIVQDGETLAFVEVRTRECDDPVPPEDTVGPAKQHRIRRAAAWYRTRHGRPDLSYRYDIVAVVLAPGQRPVIRHLPDAFR